MFFQQSAPISEPLLYFPAPLHQSVARQFKKKKSPKEESQKRASDVDAERLPAVLFAAAAPILGRGCRPVSHLPVRLFSRWSGARLGVELVVLVEVAVLYHAEAGGGAQVLAAALVLLDGLVQGPQLAQQRHVLLTQTHLQGADPGVGLLRVSNTSDCDDNCCLYEALEAAMFLHHIPVF